MASITEIKEYINSIAPFESAMSWDNSGLLIESSKSEIKKIAVCLDITNKVALKAAEDGCDLIISHHPVIFSPIKRVGADSVVRTLLKNDIAAICAHTNLDIAENGVNTALANALELCNIVLFDEGIGACGSLKRPMSLEELCLYIKDKLNSPYVGLVRADGGKETVTRLALCSGAGVDFIGEAEKYGAEAFLTGEAKHNELIEAKEGATHLILAGHFATENVIVKPLADMIRAKFPECEVTAFDDAEPIEAF